MDPVTPPSPTRILMTADTVGGVWTYCVELARALTPWGVHVTLATMGARMRGEQRDEAASIPGLEVVESDYRLEWMSNPWEDVERAGQWLLQLEKTTRPDVIHLNGYAHGALPWNSPVLIVGHSCVLSWWQAVKGEPAPDDWLRYREQVTHGLRAAAIVAAPTLAMLNCLEAYYGPFRNSRVILNGRAAAFHPGRKEPFILSIGRLWDEAKNVAALDTAAAQLPWPVYLVGDCRHPNGGEVLPRHAQTLGRLDSASLQDWLGRASIYALAAKYEPFGLSALEAAFAGCALVLGDIPSLREVWADAAVYVCPNDPEALNRTLRELIHDPVRREQLADRARIRAKEFTPERMAVGYLTAYQSLIQDRVAPQSPGNEGIPCVS